MSLLRYELRKLFSLPMLWVFLALCMTLNDLMIFGTVYGRGFFNETSGVARALGQRVDASFLDGLTAMPRTENTDALWEAVNSMQDVFQSYDVSELSAHYEYQVRQSPLMVRWIHTKYEKIDLRVRALAESGAGMNLYAGPMTHDSHQFLTFSIPWFNWTFGVYLLILAGLVLVLSLAAAGFTVFLSQYSGHYIAMLLKAVPLFAALAWLCSKMIINRAFLFGNPLSELTGLPGAEFFAILLLAAVSAALIAVAGRQQLRREL